MGKLQVRVCLAEPCVAHMQLWGSAGAQPCRTEPMGVPWGAALKL